MTKILLNKKMVVFMLREGYNRQDQLGIIIWSKTICLKEKASLMAHTLNVNLR